MTVEELLEKIRKVRASYDPPPNYYLYALLEECETKIKDQQQQIEFLKKMQRNMIGKLSDDDVGKMVLENLRNGGLK